MSLNRREGIIAASALILGAGGMAFGLTAFGGGQMNDRIVRDAIMAHPEMLPEAMAALQQREMTKLVNQNRARIETPFGGAWEGNPKGDVTLVQFFDYACGYCRASLPDIDRLLATDKDLKIVYREMPILGEPSNAAARASLSVAQQRANYAAFHRALYAAGRPTADTIAAAAVTAGMTGKRGDMTAVDQEVASNLDLQRQLQLTGTPSWIVGDTVLNGAVGYDALVAAIKAARAKAG